MQTNDSVGQGAFARSVGHTPALRARAGGGCNVTKLGRTAAIKAQLVCWLVLGEGGTAVG